MLRTHTCGELRIDHVGEEVTLCGWVQRLRDKGGLLWIDLRDKFGLTQLMFDESSTASELVEKARGVGREFVLRVQGKVIERHSKTTRCLLVISRSR